VVIFETYFKERGGLMDVREIQAKEGQWWWAG
jgi:hypothetical protein